MLSAKKILTLGIICFAWEKSLNKSKNIENIKNGKKNINNFLLYFEYNRVPKIRAMSEKYIKNCGNNCAIRTKVKIITPYVSKNFF